MLKLFKTSVVLTILFLLCFSTASIHAEEPAPESVKGLTVEGVTENLKGASEAELGLQGLLDLQKAGPVTLLDVRSPASYAARHVKGAINIPLTDLTEKTLAAAVPDKKAPVAVMCDFSLFPSRMVPMTIQAYPVLKASGYEKIYRLNLWQNRNGPMVSQEEIEKAVPFETSDKK